MQREGLPGILGVECWFGAEMWKAGKRRQESGFKRRRTCRWGKVEEETEGSGLGAAAWRMQRWPHPHPQLAAVEAETE